MTEARLLADAKGFSTFFHVAESKVPRQPDALEHAKTELLRVRLSSRSLRLREGVVRADGTTGPLYPAQLNEFAREQWDIARACTVSPSLARAVAFGRPTRIRMTHPSVDDRASFG